ncbi:hypothetical protein [Methanosarcina mazei]|uniref:Uncharacterized protein n=1 Tax=Methanosarcina mazei TaxID=2209 RepID=A0A0F8GWJ3_METMZ|nr:hypothetical protein [Methanosarcina mazei]KKG00260.1 hypothetical protein DU31_07505 [Methanosarcina mazei]KKG00642.1 hypothetical protein DU40_10190 [Methanosarcina mazei]KKG03900.1 hypothetical protein DU47_18205 [Methanosarcina mazei]KKG09954.1 hypothetical protein DU34_12605 [Methanosarcina mazei]KKG30807.1 hypothetical protein DU49_12025 [Methanosarcina mazei]
MRNTNTDSESYSFKGLVPGKNLRCYTLSPLRKRKCCPLCDSIRIARRTLKGGYVCSNCLKVFSTPSYKVSGLGGRLPAFLLAHPGGAGVSRKTDIEPLQVKRLNPKTQEDLCKIQGGKKE